MKTNRSKNNKMLGVGLISNGEQLFVYIKTRVDNYKTLSKRCSRIVRYFKCNFVHLCSAQQLLANGDIYSISKLILETNKFDCSNEEVISSSLMMMHF